MSQRARGPESPIYDHTMVVPLHLDLHDSVQPQYISDAYRDSTQCSRPCNLVTLPAARASKTTWDIN